VQVIVSDQRMPDMSGTEFLAKVRDLYPDTVRMILSGYTDLATITEAINRGAIYRFLTKPWNDDELRGHIEAAFRSHERQASGDYAGY
jgi:response regulator RpfG family c-di-GMP phosphodiesterase